MITELTVATIGAAAVIIAALIGFIVAITTAVIAKEQKVSEFRQAWIDSLRKEISDLIALSYSLAVETGKINLLKKSEIEPTEAIAEAALLKIELHTKLTALGTLIKLRLNIDEHVVLIDQISVLFKIHMKAEEHTEEQFALLNKMQEEVHKLLKSEWERVKKGEMLYRVFKTIGKIVVGSCLTAFIVLVLIGSFPHLCQ